MVSSFLAVLIFVRFADEFGASGNIETKEQGKKKTNVTIMLFITHLLWELKVLSAPHPPLAGVVSVRFEEDEDRNLCLIAYPLKGDHGTLDSVDNSDCEPKSKLLRWTNKKHHVLETEKSPKDWVRQHRKEEKMKR